MEGLTPDGRFAYVYRDGCFVTKLLVGPGGVLAEPYSVQQGDVLYLPVLIGLPMTVERLGQIPVSPSTKDPPTISGTEVSKSL